MQGRRWPLYFVNSQGKGVGVIVIQSELVLAPRIGEIAINLRVCGRIRRSRFPHISCLVVFALGGKHIAVGNPYHIALLIPGHRHHTDSLVLGMVADSVSHIQIAYIHLACKSKLHRQGEFQVGIGGVGTHIHIVAR